MKLMQDKLRGKVMIKFAVLRANVYCFLTDGDDKKKRAKSRKKFVIKRRLIFEDYKQMKYNST